MHCAARALAGSMRAARQRTVRSRRSCGPSTAAPGSEGSHSSTRRPLRASSRAVARANAPPPSTATSKARRLPRSAGSTSAAAQRVARLGAWRTRRHAARHCGERVRAAAAGHTGGATQPVCCSACIAALGRSYRTLDATKRYAKKGKLKGRAVCMAWLRSVFGFRTSFFLALDGSGRCVLFVQRIVQRRERLDGQHRRISDG